MTIESILQSAVVYLGAALIAVPIAKRMGLGSVLGYLVAGAMIGPYVLDFVGDASAVMHAAEFGVVMMLFIIGLELEPRRLVELRVPVFFGGGLQVTLTSLLISLMVIVTTNLEWNVALAIGLVLALSSTAMVLQTLEEKGLLRTEGGTDAFGVLLFQDIAIIPIISLLPLLALGSIGAGTPSAGPGPPAGWQHGLLIISSIGAIIVVGHFLLGPVLRFVVGSGVREMSVAIALLIVIAAAYIMELVGISPALGAFLAGVVLADSEYRHELEANIAPFKGLLLGLFFISIGASIDFSLLTAKSLYFLTVLPILIGIKCLVLWLVGGWQKLARGDRILFSLALAQGGEFAFVLISVANQYHVFNKTLASELVLLVGISMAITPLLFMLSDQLNRLRVRALELPHPVEDALDIGADNRVLILGYGRFGALVGRMLLANGIASTVIDHDAGQVAFLKSLGLNVYYGDAANIDLLHAAGADQAELIIVAVDSVENGLNVVELVQKQFPQAQLLVRARNRTHAYQLMEWGVEHIYRASFGTSIDMGIGALSLLGMEEKTANRAGQLFRQHDEESLRKLFVHWRDEKTYATESKRFRDQFQRAMEEDRAHDFDEDEAG